MSLDINPKNLCFFFAAAVIALVCAYTPGFNGPFLLDDFPNIIVDTPENTAPLDQLLYATLHNNSGEFGRPISSGSLALTRILHGDTPWWFKAENLLLHLLCFAAIVLLSQRVLKSCSVPGNTMPVLTLGLASAAAWAMHPLQVSTVLYAVQRMTILSAVFTVIALLFFISAVERGLRNEKIGVQNLLGFVGFTLLSILSKENGILTPALALLLLAHAWLTRNSTMPNNRTGLRALAALTLLPLVAAASYFVSHYTHFINAYAARPFTLEERLLTQSHVLLNYIKMITLPRLSDMSLFHDDIAIITHWDFNVVIVFSFVAAYILTLPYILKRAPLVSLSIGWFLVGHALESTFLPLELMFEHRNYLPMLGPIWIMCAGLAKLYEHRPKFARIIGPTALCALFFMTYARATEWSSMQQFTQIALSQHPESARTHVHAAHVAAEKHQTSTAIQHMQVAEALQIYEAGHTVHRVTLQCNTTQTLLDQGDAIYAARHKLAFQPISAYTLKSIDTLIEVALAGHCPNITIYHLLALTESIANNPRMMTHKGSGAIALFMYSKVLYVAKHTQKALNYAERAHLLNPKNLAAAISRADWLIDLKQVAQAEEQIQVIEDIDASSLRIHEPKHIARLRRMLANAREQEQ